MKTYLITIAVLFCSCVGYGQKAAKKYETNKSVDLSSTSVTYGSNGKMLLSADSFKIVYGDSGKIIYLDKGGIYKSGYTSDELKEIHGLILYGTPNGEFSKPFRFQWYSGTDAIKYINTDTIKPKVLYGLAGVKKSEPIDTQKLYFHKFIFFTELMNKSTGRKSERYQDSCEKYYKLLYKK